MVGVGMITIITETTVAVWRTNIRTRIGPHIGMSAVINMGAIIYIYIHVFLAVVNVNFIANIGFVARTHISVAGINFSVSGIYLVS
jgi:hypothetical protein